MGIQAPLWPIAEPTDRGLRDPAFTSNKILSIHRWANWIAGFSADFVDSVIERFLPDGSPLATTILDPFAGVGTTNVEAVRYGFHTYGFEINAFAAMAARCKLDASSISTDQLGDCVARYEDFIAPHEREIDHWWASQSSDGALSAGPPPESTPPPAFRSREPFFAKAVEMKVLFSLDFARRIRDEILRDYFLLAIGSTMVSYSGYSYEPSLSTRKRLGKAEIQNAPVGSIVSNKLKAMLSDAREYQETLGSFPKMPDHRIINDSFFQAMRYLRPNSVDLLITSPPYLNNYHYVRNTRPQLYWLGYIENPAEANLLEKESFGKFWQTVREAAPMSLGFRLPELETQIEELRRVHPEKGIYGGSGWANYAASYFNDSHRLFGLASQLLKPGASAVIVVGNSLLQGIEFRLDEILAKVAQLNGLEAGVERIRSKRVGDSIVGTGLRQKPQNGRPDLYEAAVVARRPG